MSGNTLDRREPVGAPLAPGERLFALDVIRGFALLGILVMNLPDFSGAPRFFGGDTQAAWPLADRIADTVRSLFFDGKFNSLFSFLFALGFTIQLDRLQRSNSAGATKIYLRRLLVLFIFGVLHGCLLWPGDVLHVYAVLGLVLLAIRGFSDRTIFMLIAISLSMPGLRSLALLLLASPAANQQRVDFLDGIERGRQIAFGQGSYGASVIESTRQFAAFYINPTAWSMTLMWFFVFGTTMLIGLLAGRWRWLQNYHDHVGAIRRLQWWSLAIGLATAGMATVAESALDPKQPSLVWVAYRICYGLARVGIMLFYVSTIARMAHSARWQDLLKPLAAAGRLPLTNYLLQTVLCTTIFYHWGMGYWGKATPVTELALAFGLFFLVQVPLSVLWLRHHRFGPMEYLWRMLTYGRGSL